MYQFDKKPNTQLTENAQRLLSEIKESSDSVICGRNNCGKSFLLKTLTQTIGEKSAYLGPARYQNFNTLGFYSPNKNKRTDQYRNFMQQWQNNNQNIDNSPLNLQQSIADFNDDTRSIFFEIMENLLGSKMEMQYTVPENTMSQKYISVDGHNISYTSSGYRLIATLVTSLLNDDYDTYLIDEPELGISPEAQGIFADFIFNTKIRNKYFSHIKTIVLATHSTVFLDRGIITNNYFVEKTGDIIDISKVNTIADINKIHFFLLGNRLESLYMPSAIVIVEGKCDYKYIERVLQTQYPDYRFSIIQANSDNRIRDVFNVTKNLFGDIQKSPYKERIFAVIDSVHGDGLVAHLKKMGIPENNIVVWSKNGIEYYYPPAVIKELFHSNDDLVITDDTVSLAGAEYKKNELVDIMLPKIDKDTEYNSEFKTELLMKVEVAIGLTNKST